MREHEKTASPVEFSSPGPEFFPPRAEFAPPAEEFSPPQREVVPPVEEQHTAGAEYEQTAAAAREEKKKRRISPLMLTGAAVAASAVVIGGVNLYKNFDLPKILLDTEQAVLLENIEDALQTQNTDALLELVREPALHTLVTETVPEYYMEWHEDEDGLDFVSMTDTEGETLTGYFCSFSFDGEYLSASWLDHATGDDYFFHLQEIRDKATGKTRLSEVWIEWDEENITRDTETLFDGYSFYGRFDGDDRLESLSVHSLTLQNVYEPENDGEEYWTWLPREISGWSENYADWTVSVGSTSEVVRVRTQRETITGQCVFAPREVTEDGVEHRYTDAFLENGTIETYIYDVDGNLLETVVVEFRDGYEVRDGVLREDLYHTCNVFQNGGNNYSYAWNP